jgi:putative membrane protein
MTVRRTFQGFLMVALVAGLTACQRGNNIAQAAREERSINPNAENPGKMVPQSDGNSWSEDDKAVTYDLESKNLEEVDLAKYVNELTKSNDVKTFTNKLITDHSAALDQIRELLKKQGINQPVITTPTKELSNTTALRNTPQSDLDANYLGMMVEEHQKDIDELKTAEASVQNSELKKYIQQLIPVLDGHRSQAESLENKFNKVEKR